MEAAANIQKEREDLSELWRKRLERAAYEAERAERQYHLVEPKFLGERFRRGKL